MTTLEDMIKKAVKKKAVFLGSKEAIDAVLKNKANSVVVAFNCPRRYREEAEHLAGIAGTDIKEFAGTGVELGAVCGKPFSVAMLAMKLSEVESK